MSSEPLVDGRSGFFFAMSLAILAVVVVGFAPTLYLRAFFDVPPVPFYVLAHGVALTAWFACLAAQATLVRAGRVATHRRLGQAGLVVAAAVVVTGLTVTFGAVHRVRAAGLDLGADTSVLGLTGGQSVLDFLTFVVWANLGSVATFIVLVAAAVWLRRNGAAHKRLMLLASLSILAPAIARIARLPGLGGDTGPVVPLVVLVLLAAVIVNDWRTLRRVHPATLAGAGLTIALAIGAQVAVHSAWGRAFVAGLG